jgi:hypothetical protein
MGSISAIQSLTWMFFQQSLGLPLFHAKFWNIHAEGRGSGVGNQGV